MHLMFDCVAEETVDVEEVDGDAVAGVECVHIFDIHVQGYDSEDGVVEVEVGCARGVG